MSHERPPDRRSYGKLLDLAFVPQCVFEKSIHAVARRPSGHRQKFVFDHQSGCLVLYRNLFLITCESMISPTKLPGRSFLAMKRSSKRRKKEKLFDWPIDSFGLKNRYLENQGWGDLDLSKDRGEMAPLVWLVAGNHRSWCMKSYAF